MSLKNYVKCKKLPQRHKTIEKTIDFQWSSEILSSLEVKIYKHVVRSYKTIDISQELVLEELEKAKIIIEQHHSLFIDELNDLINKVRIFGFHFASLDIRQDSRIHHDAFTNMVKNLIDIGDTTFPKNYSTLSENDQINILSKVKGSVDIDILTDELSVKTMGSIFALKTIQERNGERGLTDILLVITKVH